MKTNNEYHARGEGHVVVEAPQHQRGLGGRQQLRRRGLAEALGLGHGLVLGRGPRGVQLVELPRVLLAVPTE